jgi:hypothetical protein
VGGAGGACSGRATPITCAQAGASLSVVMGVEHRIAQGFEGFTFVAHFTPITRDGSEKLVTGPHIHFELRAQST